jgi:hypothetical protein
MKNEEIKTELLRERHDVAAVELAKLLDGPHPLLEDIRAADQRVLNAAAAYGRRLLEIHLECMRVLEEVG